MVAAGASPEEERRNSPFLNKAELGDWYAEEAKKKKRFLNKADLADWWMRKAGTTRPALRLEKLQLFRSQIDLEENSLKC